MIDGLRLFIIFDIFSNRMRFSRSISVHLTITDNDINDKLTFINFSSFKIGVKMRKLFWWRTQIVWQSRLAVQQSCENFLILFSNRLLEML